MIRYAGALEGLEGRIEAHAPGWLDDARLRTAALNTLRRYDEDHRYTNASGRECKLGPCWSDVKAVYIALQRRKCIFCENQLEADGRAGVAWDLEHFRPKSRVRRWPSESVIAEIERETGYRYNFQTGDPADSGYYLLAYHHHNYAAACKTCNSPHKSDFFPIAGTRTLDLRDPADGAGEEPFLVYPLGPGDGRDDPEGLIRFVGNQAFPRHDREDDEAQWRRGRVLIDFFGLNRAGLKRERGLWLALAVWPNFKGTEQGDAQATRFLTHLESPAAPFTNCTRWFLAVCRADRATAARLIDALETEYIHREQ